MSDTQQHMRSSGQLYGAEKAKQNKYILYDSI